MTEYEFSKKPWRMTSPPANEGEWLVGYEGVKCRLETDPTRIAILCREATWGSVYDFKITPDVVENAMKELEGGRVLGAAYEAPAFAFVMRGSRSTMDQLLRLRESAGAAHTTRDNDFRNFNIIVPNTIEALKDRPSMDDEMLYSAVREHIAQARKLYGALVDAGVPPQDARYIALPMGYQGDWVQIMNLRALIKECEQRLCNGLTQHESNYMVRLQRDLVVEQWPWMDKLLRSACEKRGQCASRSMLFPPCGAFGQFAAKDENRVRSTFFASNPSTAMEIAQDQYDPEAHLYSPEQNDAMQFAQWDADRKMLEHKYPGVKVLFHKPPRKQGQVAQLRFARTEVDTDA